jgi:hypothetical protein
MFCFFLASSVITVSSRVYYSILTQVIFQILREEKIGKELMMIVDDFDDLSYVFG